MDERGVRLTASNAATARRYSSADLGRTLRSVLLAPRKGFASAFALAEKRAGAGARPAEGVTAYVLTALGGASAMLLWLKLGSLLGAREIAATEFRWSYVVVALAGGAVLALMAQAVWGFVGSASFRLGGRDVRARELRLVWGASAFPQVLVLVFLLPLDLVIVGPETFTSTRLSDPVASGWAAISIALSISLAIWSLYLFARGIQVATDSTWTSSFIGFALALACALAVVVALLLAAMSLDGST